MIDTVISPSKGEVEIAVVGKYISLKDAYKSIYEALTHGGIANNMRVNVRMIESEELEKNKAEKLLSDVDGVLVSGGFGARGIAGKINAVNYARENKIPFFGICLGMHCATIEFARNVCDMKTAHSAEFSGNTEYPVIDLMEEQKLVTAKGGTMRLGAYPCVIKENTFASEAYNSETVYERHRHRYEFNTKYVDVLTENGFLLSGMSPDGKLVEIVEIKEHPWFVACQFHPEFQSTPLKAHPLFKKFIDAASKYKNN